MRRALLYALYACGIITLLWGGVKLIHRPVPVPQEKEWPETREEKVARLTEELFSYTHMLRVISRERIKYLSQLKKMPPAHLTQEQKNLLQWWRDEEERHQQNLEELKQALKESAQGPPKAQSTAGLFSGLPRPDLLSFPVTPLFISALGINLMIFQKFLYNSLSLFK